MASNALPARIITPASTEADGDSSNIGGGGGIAAAAAESTEPTSDPATTAARTPQQQQQQQQQQQDKPNPSATTPTPTTKTSTTAEVDGIAPRDQVVLDYLRQKGLGNAAVELMAILKKKKEKDQQQQQQQQEQEQPTASSSSNNQNSSDGDKGVIEMQICDDNDNEDETSNLFPKKSPRERLEEEDLLFRSQRSLLAKSTGGGYGYDRDAAWPIAQWGVPDTGRDDLKNTVVDPSGSGNNRIGLGIQEARAYLDAFTSIQLWVLSLPDEDGVQYVENPVMRAKALLLSSKNNDPGLDEAIQAVLRRNTKHSRSTHSNSSSNHEFLYALPPSTKPELLSVCFALLVHTYCELLEVGMESTAHTLRDAFRSVYEPLYASEYHDLYQCTTVEDIMRLNSYNSQHMEAISNLKSILVQVASYQLRRQELVNAAQAQAQVQILNESNSGSGVVSSGGVDAEQRENKIRECDRNVGILKNRYTELSQKASLAFDNMHDLPFLRRARAVRWQLTLSTQTFGLLSSFLRSKDDSLLAMSTLLQTKCELHVEKRDPLPFTPSCVFDEIMSSSDREKDNAPFSRLELNKMDICWAAPVAFRQTPGETLPFPKYHLEEEYDDENQAAKDQATVEFNRALLLGFRRLEALERKREYESMSESAQKRLKESGKPLVRNLPSPFEPSIHHTTLCSSSPMSSNARSSNQLLPTYPQDSLSHISTIWDESGVGLCCAKMVPLDGRRIAVGCDDSAIRIFDLIRSPASNNESSSILLGHQNGFPVFDVDWNRDGRCLLSAGGDGSVRLWDTLAVGPLGEVVPVQYNKNSSHTSTTITAKSAETVSGGLEMEVPGWRPEDPNTHANGSVLAVYRGHAPSSPVWSVAFAPCGYYFCSTGGDATARLWTTDYPVPARLFVGHSSSNVNCVDWHPNCNYIVTGGDDKTVRMWDIQSGRTVRLLDGCAAGISTVKVAPGGKYVAGADFSGIVHLWDLSTGRKVTQFGATNSPGGGANRGNRTIIHRLSFSRCGSALATGGDGCIVKIWDVRSDIFVSKPVVRTPVKRFPSKQSVLMDLFYTKRNLLMSVGKYVTPISHASVE